MKNQLTNWKEEANKYLLQGKYTSAEKLYEEAIIREAHTVSHYWHLGLLLLLQGKEIEAQMIWMQAVEESEEELDVNINELIEVLEKEAERRESITEYSLAWLIRQHIKEINPSYLNNLLVLIFLSIKLDKFSGDELSEWNVINVLQTENNLSVASDTLLVVLREVLEAQGLHPASLEFTEVALGYLPNTYNCLCVLLPIAMKIGNTFKRPRIAASYLELYLCREPDNLEVLRHVATFYQNAGNYSQGIEKARLCYSLSEELGDKISAIHLVLRGLMNAGGYWEAVESTCQELEYLFQEFIKVQPIELSETLTLRLLTPSFTIPHIKDSPVEFRKNHNKIADIFQSNIQAIYPCETERFQHIKKKHQELYKSKKTLKIGYLSHCFRQHSVGWLARWLFQHHNKDEFKINTYFVNYKLTDDYLQEWYVNNSSQAHKLGIDTLEIAEKIYEDEIDILVDLDSITLDISSEVIALKPAPIQVTWLGWDASGIPAIDYYIADPYVLPDSAQNYYTEKIWRLPQTYIAVDGFEVGIPNLRRNELDIPSDAVVYLSAQRGYKRHPDTTRWQMKILKEVPNSYFLIKGSAEEESIRCFFYQIAEEEGVDCSQLRFLPDVASELTHRANLAIADVVLDTYPYNGATTTLETLWMCIPIVTRVGEQFAARNSYTMMINAGITEGISWTDEEYIEWGIRLGKDATLRREISWKLRQSRQTAPLWNGKKFTRDMEKAYEQMWQGMFNE
jgi:predicted O-linked N-acetylglucosamine transferase (SPINDLY family)